METRIATSVAAAAAATGIVIVTPLFLVEWFGVSKMHSAVCFDYCLVRSLISFHYEVFARAALAVVANPDSTINFPYSLIALLRYWRRSYHHYNCVNHPGIFFFFYDFLFPTPPVFIFFCALLSRNIWACEVLQYVCARLVRVKVGLLGRWSLSFSLSLLILSLFPFLLHTNIHW